MTLPTGNLEKYWHGPTVTVSGVSVADASQSKLVAWLASQKNPDRPVLAYALHIGGLVHLRRDASYMKKLNRGSVVYADGAGIVILGRRNGGSLDRSPTTDLAPDVLSAMASERHLPRVAMLGGPVGMAEEASNELSRLGLGNIVFAGSGYQDEWGDTLQGIKASQPDILFVGMGAPREMEWCETHYADLPNCVVITCGGWFGFLAGHEQRAPKLLQVMGFEWVWRLAQSPRRLFPRYAAGLVAFILELITPEGRRQGA